MEKIFLFDYPPKNLTYPEYAKEVYPLAFKRNFHLMPNMVIL
jgi:hypothetical protein